MKEEQKYPEIIGLVSKDWLCQQWIAAAPNMVVLRICNIPSVMTVSDLRAYFSVHVEKGAFSVFHYRHRRRLKCANQGTLEKHDVLVRVQSEALAQEVLQQYNEKLWKKTYRDSNNADDDNDNKPWDENGLLEEVCVIRREQIDEMSDNVFERARLPHAPSLLPQGNVGTPTNKILELISCCVLPHRALKQFDLQYLQEPSGGKYSAVPPPDQLTAGAKKNVHTNYNQHVFQQESNRRKRWLLTTECTDDEARNFLEQDPPELEEWERHISSHPEQLGHKWRTHTTERDDPTLEEPVERVWDKGDATGLVMYTDDQIFEKFRGGFDEKHADDWDVGDTTENEERYGKGAVPFATLAQTGNYDDTRSPWDGKAGPGAGWGPEYDDRQRIESNYGCKEFEYSRNVFKKPMVQNLSDYHADKPIRECGYTGRGMNVAKEVMRQQGWIPGDALGRRNRKGIIEPVEPQLNVGRQGLGFKDVRSRVSKFKRNKEEFLKEYGSRDMTIWHAVYPGSSLPTWHVRAEDEGTSISFHYTENKFRRTDK